MPLIFRSMIDSNGKPVIGSDSNMLGARLPPHPRADIIPDETENVSPGTGGMSVAPNWRDLPYFLIPSRLKHLARDARGKPELSCFRFGEGPFVESEVTEMLILKPNNSSHATVQPSHSMTQVDYQEALAMTRDDWRVDEE